MALSPARSALANKSMLTPGVYLLTAGAGVSYYYYPHYTSMTQYDGANIAITLLRCVYACGCVC